jgi:hypothetical protein
MGRPQFRARARRAAEGLRARVSPTPDLWEGLGGGDPERELEEDLSAWLELPPDFRAPDDDDTTYRQSARFDLREEGDEDEDGKWAMYGCESPTDRAPRRSRLGVPGFR